MSVIALAMIAGLHLLEKADQEKIALLMSNERNEKKVLFDKIIEFKSKSLENFVYDYTYWDEMVRFVKSGNKLWAEENIDASIPTFNIDIAWVYRKNLSPVYSTSRIDTSNLEELPLSKDVLEKIVSKGPFCHFFLFTDPGLMEINGASIHPTFDQDRKTPTQGYFFVGRLWTKAYQKEISGLLGMDISLTPTEKEQPIAEKEDLKNFIITNTIPLKGWDGTHIANVTSTTKINIAESLEKQSNIQYLTSIAYLIVVLIFLSFVLFRLINRPLNLLSRSLAKNNPDLIKRLAKQKNEFGNLAVMIGEFFNQKNQLEKDIAERKRIDDAISKERTLLRTLIDNLPSGIFVKDKDYRKIISNPIHTTTVQEHLKYIGMNSDIDILDKTDFEVFPKELAEQFFIEDQKVIRDGHSIINNIEFGVRADGEKIWLLVSKVPLRDKDGSIVGMIGITNDITERKRAEKTLKESEEHFRNIYENMTIGMYRTTPDGQIVMCNPALIQMLGYTSFEELAQRNLEKEGYEPKYDRKMFRQKIEKDGKIHGLESAWMKKDGSFIYVSESARVIRDEAGKALYYEGTIEDITARKQAEKALRESEERYRTMIDNSNDLIQSIAPDGHLLFVNPNWRHILGYSKKEVSNLNLFDIIHPDCQEHCHPLFERIFRGENIPHIEVTFVAKDGRPVFLEGNASPRFLDGKAIATQSFFHDVTERKLTEKALRESEKNYRELIDGMNETVWVIDFKENLIDVNKTATEVLGYSKEELLTIGLFGIDTSLKKKDIKALAKSMPADKLQIFETSHTTKDGRMFPVEVYSSLVTYQGKQAILSIARDITERKKAEEALYSINKRLQVLHRISETIHESLEPDVIFKRITDAVVKSMGFSTALVLTLDEKEENFKVRSLTSSKSYLSGINKILGFPLMKLVVPASEVIEGIKNAASTSDMIITNYLSEIVHPPLNKSVCNALQKLGDSKSYILIPLILEGKLIGAMIVTSSLEQIPKTDIDMLNTFASTAVQAITNADMLAKTNKAKEQIQNSLEEKEILLRELYHRTKNNMQVISSMLRLKARSVKEQKISEVFNDIENKILSMAAVHQKLYESKDLSHLNLKDYFNSLLLIFKQSYNELIHRISIQTDMDDINVLIDTAIPLGLVFNELISNIVKHAFRGKTKGGIRIGLHLSSKKEIVLEISDNGVGFPKGFDIQKDIHLGLETVIDLIEYQLGGKIYFKSQNGLYCRIVIKEDRYKPRV